MAYKFKNNIKLRWTRDELQSAVTQSISWNGLARLLCGSDSCGNVRTLKRYVGHYNISTSHFSPVAIHQRAPKYTPEQAFVENSHVPTTVLVKMYRKLYPATRCEECGIPPCWNGKPLTLHIDHKNGHGTDWRLDNCRYLCPNCHYQTDTHGTKRGYTKRSAEFTKSPHEVSEAFDQYQDYKIVGEMFGISDRAVKTMVKKFNRHQSNN